MRHKFNAVRKEVDGKKFPSKLEAHYYEHLKRAKARGELLFFLRQVPFDLPGNIVYRLDFLEFWTNGEIIFSECKGYETPDWVIKHKLIIDTYPWIELNIVKKI
jgi:hypothetical protein